MADLFAFQVVSERAKCHELTIWYKDLPVYSQGCPVEEANEVSLMKLEISIRRHLNAALVCESFACKAWMPWVRLLAVRVGASGSSRSGVAPFPGFIQGELGLS